ncbi:MAG: hypothetical protein OEY23_02870 [Acidimicrobiia bacterium]|nr:hypothetical protein [Acidimicrobiia bacterium]
MVCSASTRDRDLERVDQTLAWARGEVLELLGHLVQPDSEAAARSVNDRLVRLCSTTDDPGRRLALLLQLSVACAGIIDIADFRSGVDRETLVADLAPALRSTLADPTERDL